MSIGYRAIDAVKATGGRELRKVDLWEVSFVTFPMLPDAMVQSVKALTDPDPIEIKRFVEGFCVRQTSRLMRPRQRRLLWPVSAQNVR